MSAPAQRSASSILRRGVLGLFGATLIMVGVIPAGAAFAGGTGATVEGTVTTSTGTHDAGDQISVTTRTTVVGSDTIDSSGHYSIPDVPPGDYTLVILGADASTGAEEDEVPVTVGPSDTVVEQDIQTQPVQTEYTIEGTLSDFDDQPVVGASVQLSSSAGPVADEASSSAGAFTFYGLPADTYTLTVTDPAYETATQTVVLDQANRSNVEFIQLTSAPTTGTIEGTITGILPGTDGSHRTPLDGVTVTLEGATDTSAVTDSSGHYVIDNLQPGLYNLELNPGPPYDRKDETVDVDTSTHTIDVNLIPSGAQVGGQITDASTGAAIPGANISLTDSSGDIDSAVSDNEGAYAIFGLATGTYTLSVNGGPTYQTSTSTVTVTATTTSGGSDAQVEADVQLQPLPTSATVDGTITGGSGKLPIAGANVVLSNSTGPVGSAVSDSSGSYSIENVAPGSYSLTVSPGPAFLGAARTINLAASFTPDEQDFNLAPVLTSIAVTPNGSSTGYGSTVQFKATGTYSDGTTQDLTSAVSWSSSASAVATIAGTGQATTAGVGTTTITANDGAVNGSTQLTVTRAGTVLTVSAQRVPVGLLGVLGLQHAVDYTVTLVSAVTGQPVANQQATVAVHGWSVCTLPLTDANGVATCQVDGALLGLLAPPAGTAVSATYAGSALYQPSAATTSVG